MVCNQCMWNICKGDYFGHGSMRIKEASQPHMCTYIQKEKALVRTIPEHNKECTNDIAIEVQATATRLCNGVQAFTVKGDIKLLKFTRDQCVLTLTPNFGATTVGTTLCMDCLQC